MVTRWLCDSNALGINKYFILFFFKFKSVANSALNLNGGYGQLPAGPYLNSPQYTIAAWVLPQNVILPYARVIEFSNGCHNNSVTLLFDQNVTPWTPKLEMYDLSAYQYQLSATLNLTNGLWQHLAVTYDGTQMRFYLNAILLQTSGTISYAMPLGVRTDNFIGGTPCQFTGVSSSYVDDIRVYGTSLSQSQINDVMMSNETNFNTSICQASKLN